MIEFWQIVAFIILAMLVIQCREVVESLHYYSQVKRSARRMKVRDKGKSDGNWVCTACGTDVRTGIDEKGVAHQYCWRCECYCDDVPEPDPKEPQDLPVEVAEPKVALGTDVAVLADHRKRKKA